MEQSTTTPLLGWWNRIGKGLFAVWAFFTRAGQEEPGPPLWPLPDPTFTSSNEAWVTIADQMTNLNSRNEACFVMLQEKAVLVGGRRKNTVNIYDPVARVWEQGATMPMELHHMQCIARDGEVWIVTAWTGESPYEEATSQMHIYDLDTDTWSSQPGLPEERRRGAAAVVQDENKIYVSHGNRGGHGEHSDTLGWLDVYDTETQEWTVLPDAPNPRDHTGGGLMPDGRICIAGGRDSGQLNFAGLTVKATDCYDPSTNTWTVEGDLFIGAAGSAYGMTCDGQLMMAGGEDDQGALPHVQRFNGTHWELTDYLNRGRHGTSLAADCRCNQIHIASGSGDKGGKPELFSIETLFPNGIDEPCVVDD